MSESEPPEAQAEETSQEDSHAGQVHKLSDAEAVERLAKAHRILLREIHKVIIGQDLSLIHI